MTKRNRLKKTCTDFPPENTYTLMASAWAWGKSIKVREIESQYHFGHQRIPPLGYRYQPRQQCWCTEVLPSVRASLCTRVPSTGTQSCPGGACPSAPAHFAHLLEMLCPCQVFCSLKHITAAIAFAAWVYPGALSFWLCCIVRGFCLQNLCIGVLVAVLRLCVEAGRKMQGFPPSLFISLRICFQSLVILSVSISNN